MLNNNIIEGIGNYYDNLVNTFGHDPRACDYGHSNSQKIKFEVLSRAISYDDKTVLDIGCGFADYYDFLRNKFRNISYHGVDISQKMIVNAKKLHPDVRLEFTNVFANPPTQKYNIVTANGIFYLLGKQSSKLMHECIRKMFDMADELVVFNSLSAWAPDKEDTEFYADPLETITFCRTLSPWVTLLHDYHPRDFTIYLYKKRNI